MKRYIGIIAVLAGLSAGAWYAVSHFFPEWLRHQQVSKDNKIRPTIIRIAPVTSGSITKNKTVSAVIKATQSVAIVPEIQGRIVAILFKEGEHVKKGQLLIQLDEAQAGAHLKEAEAQVKVAAANYKRQKLLYDKKYGSKSSLDKAEADLASALANREKALVSVRLTKIVAPFSGQIGFTGLSVGSQVDPRQEITRLVSSNPLSVEFQIPESDIRYLHKNKKIDVLVEGYDSVISEATIVAIEPYSDPVAHSIKVKALMGNPDNKFRDGAFASVTIPLIHEDNAILVPSEAVLKEDEKEIVFVIADDVSIKREVSVGATEDGKTQILSGLKVGEYVATDPVDMLMDGGSVRVESD